MKKPKIREIDSPVRAKNRKKGAIFLKSSNEVKNSIGSMNSPRGSQYENQLRLDLISEEENIDELWKGTQN